MAVQDSPKTYADLYTALMNRLRLDSSNSVTAAQAKQYINLGLMNMHMGFGEKFPWAERQATIITQASYATGTASVSAGGTAVTGASTLWNTNNNYGVANVRAGGKIVFDGESNVYEVSSVSSDTALTLATRYVGSAALSAASYTYFEDEYDLAADFLKPVDQQNFDINRQIPLISRTEFRQKFPRVITTGKIRFACIQDRAPSANTTPRRRVRFHLPPSANVMVRYAYVTKYLATTSAGTATEILNNDTDEPIVPYQYRHGIVLYGLRDWYRDKKDDDRFQAVEADYTLFMLRVTADGDVGQPHMRIQPRMGGYRASAARPYSRGSRRYDTGGAFDRLEDR